MNLICHNDNDNDNDDDNDNDNDNDNDDGNGNGTIPLNHLLRSKEYFIVIKCTYFWLNQRCA